MKLLHGVRPAALLVLLQILGCATPGPIVTEDGTPVYEMTVLFMDGLRAAASGPTELPLCTIKVGSRETKVWLAPDRATHVDKVPTLVASETDFKTGIEINTAWQTTVMYSLTNVELKLGRASVEVPGIPKPIIVELRFRPAPGR